MEFASGRLVAFRKILHVLHTRLFVNFICEIATPTPIRPQILIFEKVIEIILIAYDDVRESPRRVRNSAKYNTLNYRES